jgi:L-methionine (R)-S-oxide reductase
VLSQARTAQRAVPTKNRRFGKRRSLAYVLRVFAATDLSKLPKPELYRELADQISAVTQDETDPVANMANVASLIFHSVPRLNWAGFYLLKGGELVLGPFQGRPACVRIGFGRGVVGTAAEKRTTIRVADVNEFPGHIACDSASRSEIVVPLVSDDSHLLGVLDVDSPDLDRFDAEDEAGLKAIGKIIAAKL